MGPLEDRVEYVWASKSAAEVNLDSYRRDTLQTSVHLNQDFPVLLFQDLNRVI